MPQEKYLSILRQYWGYDNFRGIQHEIIESIGEGHDTLGLMPTGGGKSITFQVPALALPGICVVVTPLIALMKDQVIKLKKLGIKAAAIHSAMERHDIITTLENCIFGGYKILYVSPERLSSELFQTKFRHMDVSFITVDEAHCICQWGYDFRPSYLKIAEIRKIKPDIPFLALTATATPEVVQDIQEKLLFKDGQVFKMSFFRKNLAYQVYHAEEQSIGMVHLLKSIPGSSIIYTRNRQHCKDISDYLNTLGFSATYYHAGIEHSERDERQKKWLCDEYRIMVATNAFGMGIDKPDVRLVLHVDLPDSIEEYFQEAGRAGRDGENSYAIIVIDGKELDALKRRVGQTFPKVEYIKDIYEKICFYFQMALGDGMNVTREFNIEDFCRTFKFHPLMARNALSILDMAGYIEYTDAEEGDSRVRICATRNELFNKVSGNKEVIANNMLRNFCGIFVDYVYFDEDLICKETGLNKDVVYNELKEMTNCGLIHYIPRKRIPRITFKQRRVEKEDIYLPDSVYARRMETYAERIKQMYDYCTREDKICRSKILLNYFGETQKNNCGICDICKEEKAYEITKDEFTKIRNHLIKQLQDGPVKAEQLDISGIDENKLFWVIEYMRGNEELEYEGNALIFKG